MYIAIGDSEDHCKSHLTEQVRIKIKETFEFQSGTLFLTSNAIDISRTAKTYRVYCSFGITLENITHSINVQHQFKYERPIKQYVTYWRQERTIVRYRTIFVRMCVSTCVCVCIPYSEIARRGIWIDVGLHFVFFKYIFSR